MRKRNLLLLALVLSLVMMMVGRCKGQTIPDDDPPMPVDFTGWTVKRIHSIVVFKWSTASEKNNDYFTIESSKDGANWIEIAKIAGHGDSIIPIYYNFSYENTDKLYYRISQIDFDGTLTPQLATVLIDAYSLTEEESVSYFDSMGRETNLYSSGFKLKYVDGVFVQKIFVP